MIGPHREIDRFDKEQFIDEVVRLEPYLGLELPIDDAYELLDLPSHEEAADEPVSLTKRAAFSMNGTLFSLKTIEIFDDEEDAGPADEPAYARWSVTAQPEPLLLEGIMAAIQEVYSVSRLDDGWLGGDFERRTASGPEGVSDRMTWKSGVQTVQEAFIASNPSVGVHRARREEAMAEMRRNHSSRPLAVRFTHQRLSIIMPLLERLGPQHLLLDSRADPGDPGRMTSRSAE